METLESIDSNVKLNQILHESHYKSHRGTSNRESENVSVRTGGIGSIRNSLRPQDDPSLHTIQTQYPSKTLAPALTVSVTDSLSGSVKGKPLASNQSLPQPKWVHIQKQSNTGEEHLERRKLASDIEQQIKDAEQAIKEKRRQNEQLFKSVQDDRDKVTH